MVNQMRASRAAPVHQPLHSRPGATEGRRGLAHRTTPWAPQWAVPWAPQSAPRWAARSAPRWVPRSIVFFFGPRNFPRSTGLKNFPRPKIAQKKMPQFSLSFLHFPSFLLFLPSSLFSLLSPSFPQLTGAFGANFHLWRLRRQDFPRFPPCPKISPIFPSWASWASWP